MVYPKKIKLSFYFISQQAYSAFDFRPIVVLASCSYGLCQNQMLYSRNYGLSTTPPCSPPPRHADASETLIARGAFGIRQLN